MSGHHRLPSEGQVCTGCQIPLSDGYVYGCKHCSDRRCARLARGERFTLTCYPGEAIDNQDVRGRIVAA